VLVLGGAGFIGRHAVAALRRRGCAVVVGTRRPQRRAREHARANAVVHPAPAVNRTEPAPAAAGYREVHLERLLRAEDWADALQGVGAVINCVGILRQRGRETYDRVHHLAPAALAAACAARGLRLIHVSALGLDGPARSRFLRSKRDGEAALRASAADWRIVRPSLLDGDGGYGARWLRRVAAWPVHPLPRGACGRIAVLHVEDLGEALATLVLHQHPDALAHTAPVAIAAAASPVVAATPAEQREFDLGGRSERSLAQHLAALRAERGAPSARILRVPDAATRLLAHLCDLLHVTPFSFGHWELLQRDNLPQHNALPALLGRAPRAVGVEPAGPIGLPAPGLRPV
jgi:NADH dehydrogenase